MQGCTNDFRIFGVILKPFCTLVLIHGWYLPGQFSLLGQIFLHWAAATLKGLVKFQNKNKILDPLPPISLGVTPQGVTHKEVMGLGKILIVDCRNLILHIQKNGFFWCRCNGLSSSLFKMALFSKFFDNFHQLHNQVKCK